MTEHAVTPQYSPSRGQRKSPAEGRSSHDPHQLTERQWACDPAVFRDRDVVAEDVQVLRQHGDDAGTGRPRLPRLKNEHTHDPAVKISEESQPIARDTDEALDPVLL